LNNNLFTSIAVSPLDRLIVILLRPSKLMLSVKT